MLAPSPRPEFLGALSLATVFRRKFDNFDFVWLRCWDQHFSLRFPQKFKFNLQSWNFPTVTFYVWLEYASKLLRYSVASWQFSKLLYFKIIRLPAINIKRDSRKILNIQSKFPKIIVFDFISKLFGCLQLASKHQAWQSEDLECQVKISKTNEFRFYFKVFWLPKTGIQTKGVTVRKSWRCNQGFQSWFIIFCFKIMQLSTSSIET